MDETYRITNDNGVLCASFRADNLCNHINNYIAERRSGKMGDKSHKLNLTEDEFRLCLELAGYVVERLEYIENTSLLCKMSMRHARRGSAVDEEKDSSAGYRLNKPGERLQAFLLRFFQSIFTMFMLPLPAASVSRNSKRWLCDR